MGKQSDDIPEIFYKYRNLKDFNFVLDILFENRLHAAKYTEMDDPKEGHYCYQSKDFNGDIEKIRQAKEGLKICSLSGRCDNSTLWTYYADKFRGVAIGVTLHTNDEPYKIIYGKQLPVNGNNNDPKMAKKILTHKLKCWEHEEEWRVFTADDYVKVEIKEIILGRKMKDDCKDCIEKLIKKINSKIDVKRQT
jgi:hypothetical protein